MFGAYLKEQFNNFQKLAIAVELEPKSHAPDYGDTGELIARVKDYLRFSQLISLYEIRVLDKARNVLRQQCFPTQGIVLEGHEDWDAFQDLMKEVTESEDEFSQRDLEFYYEMLPEEIKNLGRDYGMDSNDFYDAAIGVLEEFWADFSEE